MGAQRFARENRRGSQVQAKECSLEYKERYHARVVRAVFWSCRSGWPSVAAMWRQPGASPPLRPLTRGPRPAERQATQKDRAWRWPPPPRDGSSANVRAVGNHRVARTSSVRTATRIHQAGRWCSSIRTNCCAPQGCPPDCCWQVQRRTGAEAAPRTPSDTVLATVENG